MSDRIVLITGAKGGLGSFVTNRFLKNQDRVIGASLHIQASDFPNDRFTAISADFLDTIAVQKLVDETINKFNHVDVLVHVAGGFAGGTPLHETDEKTWSQMLGQNLTAAFHVFRAVIPHMRRAGSGKIVAVGSYAAEQPHANLGAYVISKLALANTVLPGTMDTPANRAAMPGADRKTWVSPADVAEVIFWLTTGSASQVNGAAIPVTGASV